MKISVDDVDLYTLTTHQKDVLEYMIPTEGFEDNLKERLQWLLTHKYDQSFKALKKEWDSKLAAVPVDPIPTDPDEYATTVFAQPTYKDKSARLAEEPPE